MSFYEKTLNNLRKIASDRDLTQATMASYMKVSESMYSRILKGEVKLKLDQVSELARSLHMSEVDIFSYPEHMVPAGKLEDSVDAILQIKINKANKDKILSILMPDDTIEIINNM